MIGFVSAITASLAVIILVVISSLIGFVQSIMPSTGMVKISQVTYRYNQQTPYINEDILHDLVVTAEKMQISSRIKAFQIGCNYGFNASQYEMKHIATYNYIVINKYLGDTYSIDPIHVDSEPDKMNSCFVDLEIFSDAELEKMTESESFSEEKEGENNG